MPGVPPNAFRKVKEALKEMIRSGGKNRKDKDAQEQQQPAQQQQTAQNIKQDKQSQQQQAATLDNPPTAAVAATGTPDHALKETTNTQDDDVNAKDAGNTLRVLSTGAPSSTSSDPSPAAQATSEPVSAVSAEGEQDIKPIPAPINPVAANSAEPSSTVPAPPSATSAHPNVVTASPTDSSQKIDTPGESTKNVGTGAATAGDHKVPVVAEEMPPPAVKTSPVAPGMSATSGPLEDFPAAAAGGKS